MKFCFSVLMIGLGSSLWGQPVQSLTQVLEQRLRSVVTVEVDPTDKKVSPIFGFTVAGQAANPASKPRAYQNSFFINATRASGSGFMIRRGTRDYVVTNAHVVRDMDKERFVCVSLTGKRYAMELVGADTIRDVAVLRFTERPGPEMLEASFRTEPVRVGERVYALGNPLGRYPSSVAEGIVSGLNRQGVGKSAGYIQSTAALSGGNSGGPLIDINGRVVGVNTFTALDNDANIQSQLNFSLNGPTALESVDQIIQSGRVVRGSLGLLIANSPKLGGGFVIAYVHPDHPVTVKEKLEGREVTAVDDVDVRNGIQLFGQLDSIKPGQKVKLTLAASKTFPAEAIILTSAELTDTRLKQLADFYLGDVLGVNVKQEVNGLSIRLAKSSYTEPEQFLIKDVLGVPRPERMESVMSTFLADEAGMLALTEAGLYLNDALSFAIPNPRALHLLVRARSISGPLTFLFRIEKEAYAVSMRTVFAGEWIRFLMH